MNWKKHLNGLNEKRGKDSTSPKIVIVSTPMHSIDLAWMYPISYRTRL